MRSDGPEPAPYVTAPCCFKRPKSVGVMITARGPRVRNPNRYHHGTGIVQTFSSIKTATVITFVDTHGQNLVAFAFCRLLGFELMPRIKNIGARLDRG